MKQKLIQAFQSALQTIGISSPVVVLDHPENLSFGEFTTSCALSYAKQLGVNPVKLAQDIVVEIEKQNMIQVGAITVAGPGFINISLSPESCRAELQSLLEKVQQESFLSIHAGKKILIEHSSPNLFKPFHVGHMMNNAIGESLVRLFQASGATVVPISFPSDKGLGIAKAVYATLHADHEILHDKNVVLAEKMKFLGDRYVDGTKAYDDSPEAAEEIKKINLEIYQEKETPAYELYVFTKELNMEYFQESVARLGTQFDSYIFEGEAGVVGDSLVHAHISDVFTESQGAIVYLPKDNPHLNPEVFITSEGHPTYGAKDLGLLKLKFDKHNPDISIIVTDYKQAPHFHVVVDAASHISNNWATKSVHIPHGRMTFKGQEMSSRLGGVPVATEVLEILADEVRKKSAERNLSEETQDMIAIGAIKFSILRVKPGGPTDFNPEASLSFEGDSGPYLQYTCARIQSLIQKGAEQGIVPSLLSVEPVSDIERMVFRFPDMVERAIGEYAPQYVATYGLLLARTFNSFYGSNMIIDSSNKEMSAHRLFLAQTALRILEKSLWLLGIKTPKEM